MLLFGYLYIFATLTKLLLPGVDSRWPHDSVLNRLRKSVTPVASLQGTRHLHICSPHLHDIATRLPPELVPTPSDAYEFNFPGVYVLHDYGIVLTERRVDVGGAMYKNPLYLNMDYAPDRDRDEDRTDGITSASEHSLAQLRRREANASGSSKLSSECTATVGFWDLQVDVLQPDEDKA